MRVLLSAIACHPTQGSESAVGWKAALALASEHRVHVLTSTSNQAGIEAFLSAHTLPNLSFTYFGYDAPYHENRLVARAQSWLRSVRWMNELLLEADKLLVTQSFDVIHHITFLLAALLPRYGSWGCLSSSDRREEAKSLRR